MASQNGTYAIPKIKTKKEKINEKLEKINEKLRIHGYYCCNGGNRYRYSRNRHNQFREVTKMANMIFSPCKDCERRKANCASSCSDWEEYVKKREEVYRTRKLYSRAVYTVSLDARKRNSLRNRQIGLNTRGEHGTR